MKDSNKIFKDSIGSMNAYITLERWEDALKYVDKVISLNENNEDEDIFIRERGIILRHLGKREESIVVFNAVLSKPLFESFHIDILLEKGITLASMDKFEEALQTFQEALEIYKKLNTPYSHNYDDLKIEIHTNLSALYKIMGLYVCSTADNEIAEIRSNFRL